jgi:hypothetical protein
MGTEERARFDRQVEAQNQKLITIGQEHLELQALPIGLPDAVPTRQLPKKKTHGLANARGLTGAEIAAQELNAREALAQDRRVATPEPPSPPFRLQDSDEDVLIPGTPPRLIGESQGGSTIILAHRPSPEQPRRAPPLRPEAPAIFRLFPEEPALPPASTAPPRLEEEGRGKRKRAHTDRYKDAVEQGDLDESQHGKAGRP